MFRKLLCKLGIHKWKRIFSSKDNHFIYSCRDLEKEYPLFEKCCECMFCHKHTLKKLKLGESGYTYASYNFLVSNLSNNDIDCM